jgi:uncharacterized protein
MAFLFSSPVLNPVIIALFLTLMGYKVALVYVIVTFIGSILAAALMARLGMEREVKPNFSIGSSCCSEKPATVQIVGLRANPLAAAQGCCATPSATSSPVTLKFSSLSTEPCCPQPQREILPVIASGSCCPSSAPSSHADLQGNNFSSTIKRALFSALGTFKQVVVYLFLGAGIGAFIYGFFPQDLVVRLAGPGNPWSIPVAAAIGVPMYIRAETVIPISAALVGKGMGVGTVLALIIGGAGASIPEMILLASMFKKKLLAAFALNVFVVAIVAGYLVDYLVY